MERYEYIRPPIYIFPGEIIQQYNLRAMGKMDICMQKHAREYMGLHRRTELQTISSQKFFHRMDITSAVTYQAYGSRSGDR